MCVPKGRELPTWGGLDRVGWVALACSRGDIGLIGASHWDGPSWPCLFQLAGSPATPFFITPKLANPSASPSGT